LNIKEYIESGVLEAYILGALPEAERLEVATNIARYPELAAEVVAIEKAMQLYAEANAVEPPAFMQDQIWNALQTETAIKDKPKVIAFEGSKASSFSWARAAIWIALIGSVVVNFMLMSQRNSLKQDQLAMRQELDTLQQRQQYLAQVVDNYKKEKEMMADSNIQTIVMKSMQPGHPMAATVYWNKAKGETYVAMKKLPMPPQGMQYQMWVIQDGKPVSMGVLPNELANGIAMAQLPMNVTNSQAFAISLEKEGGNPTPTSVYVLGKPS
jgi:anti-sigma-K factor RskA